MDCSFCNSDRDVKKVHVFGITEDRYLCCVCYRLLGTEHGRVSNEHILYAIAHLYHALGVTPPDNEDE